MTDLFLSVGIAATIVVLTNVVLGAAARRARRNHPTYDPRRTPNV